MISILFWEQPEFGSSVNVGRPTFTKTIPDRPFGGEKFSLLSRTFIIGRCGVFDGVPALFPIAAEKLEIFLDRLEILLDRARGIGDTSSALLQRKV